MTAFEQAWAKADPDAVTTGSEDNLNPPPDGEYDVALMTAEAFTSKKNETWVKTVWRTTDQAHTWTVLLGFKSEAQSNVTKAQVRELGVDVDAIDTLDQLRHALGEQAGRFFTVTVKTNGQFRNTFIDGPQGEARPDIPVPDTSDFAPAPDPTAGW